MARAAIAWTAEPAPIEPSSTYRASITTDEAPSLQVEVRVAILLRPDLGVELANRPEDWITHGPVHHASMRDGVAWAHGFVRHVHAGREEDATLPRLRLVWSVDGAPATEDQPRSAA